MKIRESKRESGIINDAKVHPSWFVLIGDTVNNFSRELYLDYHFKFVEYKSIPSLNSITSFTSKVLIYKIGGASICTRLTH